MAALAVKLKCRRYGRVMLKVPSEHKRAAVPYARQRREVRTRWRAGRFAVPWWLKNAGRSERRKQKQLLKDLQESFGGPTGEKNSPRSKVLTARENSFDDLTR